MAEDEKSTKPGSSTVLIVVAIIGVVGTLGGAGIANWDKLFSSHVSHDSRSIVGTYKYRDQFGDDFYIDFHSDGSAMQSNGDGATWTMTAPNSYTLNFASKWKIIDLTIDGSRINGTVLAPNGHTSHMVGDKQ